MISLMHKTDNVKVELARMIITGRERIKINKQINKNTQIPFAKKEKEYK